MAHVISFHDSSKEFEKKEWEDYVIYIPESREYLDSLHKMIEFVGNLPLNGTESFLLGKLVASCRDARMNDALQFGIKLGCEFYKEQEGGTRK